MTLLAAGSLTVALLNGLEQDFAKVERAAGRSAGQRERQLRLHVGLVNFIDCALGSFWNI
jgi:hypothetical protein